jgi:plastocyanin
MTDMRIAMNPRNTLVSLWSAMLLAVSATALAHEECDDLVATGQPVAKPAQASPPQKPAGSRVAIKLFQYQPGKTQVSAGTTVTWVNEDEIYHSVTADKNGFAASLDGKGKSLSFTFDRPGLYSYFCDRHEHMRGEIEVK